LITTLGGTIAAVCSSCQSQRNYEFAMDGYHPRPLHGLVKIDLNSTHKYFHFRADHR
jgi:hypothetical protein